MHLHTRPSGPTKAVAVFIHGLNGSGYGTWNAWPRLLFEGGDGTPSMDVAIYDYPSLLRAVRYLRLGADIDVQARQLADHLAELSNEYEEVYLVAHSLGGLVAESAVSIYLQDAQSKDATCLPVSPVAAIFLMASPMGGSGKALFFLSFFRDVKRLRLLSKEQARYADFFNSYVQVQCLASEGKYRFIVPRYAGIATLDIAVSATSASGALPKEQKQQFKGTHFSVVKPKEATDPQHVWVLQRMRDVQDIRAQWYRNEKQKKMSAVLEDGSTPDFFVTQLEGERRSSEWEIIYNAVRADTSTSYVEVVDYNYVRAGTKVDLLITLNDASGVMDEKSASKRVVVQAVDSFEKGRVASVGICPVGERHSEAESEVGKWLPSALQNKFYIEGSHDSGGIGQVISRWIDACLHSHPVRQSERSQRGLLQLNYDAYEEAEDL
ncbi:alpha/beta hydrolase [Streptomyces sp. NBC_01478]|uniref:esterase/lipase family protein n=1 Tax=Streptomyces sp. NBC_01478 TaxID=2903882 RepID=UPI002E324242|nr:alpha/beta hydrolase [Streptomyces sp. NBC_01478]